MKKVLLSLCLLVSVAATAQVNEQIGSFREADTNNDGIIQVAEVQKMIDGFFIGRHDRGVMYIHNLIDFFFEQPV